MGARVGIVDDHRLFREGLNALFATLEDIRIVAEAENVAGGRLVAERQDVDVLLIDWQLPDAPGSLLLREVHRKRSSLRLIVLTMFADERHLAEAFAAGASGYVSKDAGVPDLIEAIRTVSAGGRYVPRAFAARAPDLISGRFPSAIDGQSPLAALTPREREVFVLAVRGLLTAEVARQLSISPRTVETHRARLMRKLHAHSTSDLVRFAARHGLLE